MASRFNYKAMQYREWQRDHPVGSEVEYMGITYTVDKFLPETLEILLARSVSVDKFQNGWDVITVKLPEYGKEWKSI